MVKRPLTFHQEKTIFSHAGSYIIKNTVVKFTLLDDASISLISLSDSSVKRMFSKIFDMTTKISDTEIKLNLSCYKAPGAIRAATSAN